VPEDPTDEALIAFAESTLSNFGELLRDAEVLRETVTEQRDLWVMLHRITREADQEQSSSPEQQPT
jgi:hypothetical protein